jgi:hypothetical protein
MLYPLGLQEERIYILEIQLMSSLPLLGNGFNGKLSLSSGFLNGPRPKLPASNNKSNSNLCYGRQSVCESVRLGVRHPSGVHDHIFITVRHLRVCWCGIPSPRRGRACNLQLLLGPSSAVILWSEHRRTQRQSQSYLTTDGQSESLFWCRATIRARDQFFFLTEIFLRQLRVCYFVAPSLTRGRVSNLLVQSAVTLGSKSRRSVTISYCSFETPIWRARSPYLYPPGTGWLSYTPGALGSLFIASYDSQGYGGGFLTRIHTKRTQRRYLVLLITSQHGPGRKQRSAIVS